MHLPLLAVGARRQVRHLLQPEVERDEVEGRPDPGDAGDHVQPAHREGEPVPDDGEFVHHASPCRSRELAENDSLRKSRRSPSSFAFCLKMLALAAHVLRQQPAHLRPRLRARLDVGRRPRPAHLRRRRLRPHRRARAPPRRAALQPHHPQPAADRAGRHLLQGRAEDPRDDRRGRGGGRRHLPQPARLAPRRRAPRHRQAADRPARSPPSRTSTPRSTSASACPTAASTSPPRASTWPSCSARSRTRTCGSARSPTAAASSAPRPPTSPPGRMPETGQDLIDQRHDCLMHRYPGAREFVWTLRDPRGARAASRSRARSNPTTATS